MIPMAGRPKGILETGRRLIWGRFFIDLDDLDQLSRKRENPKKHQNKNT